MISTLRTNPASEQQVAAWSAEQTSLRISMLRDQIEAAADRGDLAAINILTPLLTDARRVLRDQAELALLCLGTDEVPCSLLEAWREAAEPALRVAPSGPAPRRQHPVARSYAAVLACFASTLVVGAGLVDALGTVVV